MIKQGFCVSSDDDHMSKNKDYYIHLQIESIRILNTNRVLN